MNIILLSGGSGKRLWPLSNDVRSKQFIKIFKNENQEYESMIQKMYNQICSVEKKSKITIATSKTQVSAIHNQLNENVGISIEPCRKDTFPAIALATSYLKDIEGLDENEVVVVCPVDPYVDDEYFFAMKKIEQIASNENVNLVLMGIKPTYPSEKYGYIIPSTNEEISNVVTFKEKPNKELAKEYLKQNALWNGGVFAYKLKYVLDIAHQLIDFKDYYHLYSKYNELEKISFDYAVVEKEKNIKVMKLEGKWKDLGTWNTLTESMSENIIGKAILSNNCNSVHVINELDIPILCMGLNNVVVSASPDGILVSDKEQSSYIKPYVDNINSQIRYAEKSWGSFRVLDIQEDSMTIKVTLNKGHQMNYHMHEKRNEVWTVISGKGLAIIDGEKIPMLPGDVIKMPAGCKHTIIALTELKVIEVQSGKDINIEDKIKCKLKKI